MTETEEGSSSQMSQFNETTSFENMGLDKRILKAILYKEWHHPTPIQGVAIPLVLKGKDVLIKATTGSGKTAIFLVPILNHFLSESQNPDKKTNSSVSAIVLSPTKELAFQSKEVFSELCRYCKKSCPINSVAVDPSNTTSTLSAIISHKTPDLLFGTPSQILRCVTEVSPKLLRHSKFLVIDEADAMFSFGFEKDIRQLLSKMGKNYQAIVVSATLSKEVAIIKTLLPKNLALVRLVNQELPDSTKLKQFFIKCQNQSSKFLITLALLKFNVVRGKCLIFCSSIKHSYKLKLFLDSFKISSCVLNNKLPFNSRNNVVNEFNSGKYQIVIATDSSVTSLAPNSGTNQKAESEYSLSRGIDFQEVSVVLNFDFPQESLVYIHRAGRTARGANKGTALSLIYEHEEPTLKKVQEFLRDPTSEEDPISMFDLDMKELERLRYRVSDVLSSLTNQVIFAAQKVDVHSEMFHSKELKKFFKKHPEDYAAIEHDKNRATVLLKGKFSDIGDIPGYLVPPSLKKSSNNVTKTAADDGYGPKVSRKRNSKRDETLEYYTKLGLVQGGKKKKRDPLKSM